MIRRVMPEFYTFLQAPVCRGTMMKICGSEQGTIAKNERKLTPAEQKRKEQFALVCEEMERQGYRKTDLTIGVVKANLLALIVMLPFAVLSGAVVLSRVSFRSMVESMSPFDFLLFLLVMLLLTAVHEGIHGLTWAIFAERLLEIHPLRRDLESAYALLHLFAASKARAVYSRRGHADARAWYRPDGRRGSDRDFLGLHSGISHDLRRRRGFCHYTQNTAPQAVRKGSRILRPPLRMRRCRI